MKHQLGKINVRDTADALRIAEALVERPEINQAAPVYVHMKPQDIRERLELFQPRRPGWGTRKLETRHVNHLATRIERKGELDPVLVVKLKTANPYTGALDGHEWVVVDGHHRIAAYLKKKWTAPIRCEWFGGSVREAADESLRRNEKTHLDVDQGDKAEEAWKRTLLGWGSKREVVSLTGCGEGTVAKMRRVVKWHHDQITGKHQTPMGEKLASTLGNDLRVHSWSKVNGVTLDLSPKQWDMNSAAAKLARNLVMRMTTKLSDDPEVTARALWLYDRDLCPKLLEALQACLRTELETERDLKDLATYETLGDRN
jgi:hypothetical protein